MNEGNISAQKQLQMQHVCHDLELRLPFCILKAAWKFMLCLSCVNLFWCLLVQGRNTMSTAGRGADNDWPCAVLISFCQWQREEVLILVSL